MAADAPDRVYLYDSTLRDGAQTHGVDFSAADKRAIALELDRLGIDYIEGGWPGANPTDDAFFATPPALSHGRLAAFGMTRRSGRSAANDPGLTAVLAPGTPVVTLVGKTWDFHVEVALGVSLAENLTMIADSVALAASRAGEAMFDAEHFFDGYKANPDHALACLRAAHDAGAAWLVLCDTNGGTLPHEVERIVGAVRDALPEARIGIHCHNDTETAVANSLAAVRAGARQIQGTLNGLGERCGNANLVALIPTLMLKLGLRTGVSEDGLRRLRHVSHMLDERLNRAPARSAAYVGDAAFAHKGGLHVSAVEKDPRSYEHVDPALIGNSRTIVVSDQAGRANVLAQLREMGLEVAPDDRRVPALLEEIKALEHDGMTFDGAEASFELVARRHLGGVPEVFRLHSFRVIDERRYNARGELITVSEATIRIYVAERYLIEAAEGHGPVDALNNALRKVLVPLYPSLGPVRLTDYKVRILAAEQGTAAKPRVMIESVDADGTRWSTVGLSEDVIDASYQALADSIVWHVLRTGAGHAGAARNPFP